MDKGRGRIIDQQLAFARLQLRCATASENAFSCRGHLNAGCLHLVEALLVYLHELRLVSDQSMPVVFSLGGLFKELRVHSEQADFRVREVLDQAFSADSWLNKLIRLQEYYHRLSPEHKDKGIQEAEQANLATTPPAVTPPADTSLIATSSGKPTVEFKQIEPGVALLSDIIEEMESIIARHREFSAEY